MTPGTPATLKARSADAAAGLKNLHQLIQLRWIAVVGQIFTIEVAHYGLQLPLPLRSSRIGVASSTMPSLWVSPVFRSCRCAPAKQVCWPAQEKFA